MEQNKQNQPTIMGLEKGQIHTILGQSELREPLIIKESNWRGKDRISLRYYFWNKDKALQPGRRGIEIGREHLELVIEALVKIQQAQA